MKQKPDKFRQELFEALSPGLIELFQAGFIYGIKAKEEGVDSGNKAVLQKEALREIETSSMSVFSALFELINQRDKNRAPEQVNEALIKTYTEGMKMVLSLVENHTGTKYIPDPDDYVEDAAFYCTTVMETLGYVSDPETWRDDVAGGGGI